MCFGAAIAIKVARWAFARAIDQARAVAMARVSRVFAETMAQLYPDVPVTWEEMVEQETYSEPCEPARKEWN
jgi:hypothetical protein